MAGLDGVQLELIDSVDQMKRADRQALLARIAEQHGVQRIAELLCERVNLVHIWLCKDPRTIPASKLKVPRAAGQKFIEPLMCSEPDSETASRFGGYARRVGSQ